MAERQPGMHNSTWKDEFYFRIYDLARAGMVDYRIAKVLGVERKTLKKWYRRKPILALGVELARETSTGDSASDTLADFIYRQLPSDLQEVWDQRSRLLKDKATGQRKWLKLLEAQGKLARQHLFLYAITKSSFNISVACKKVGIAKSTFDSWVTRDPDFARLVDEIEWHKGNFFEGALVNSVAAGDTNAILFANKTFNKKRGYGGEETVNVNHTHTHSIISIDAILPSLSIECRKEILEKWREYRANLHDNDSETPRVIVKPAIAN